LIGPNSLEETSRRLFDAVPNILLLGPRPYRNIPAYLQHADVSIVPHRVSPFTESLDPIKAYECLAVETPTVATRVAGFRDYENDFHVVHRDAFVSRVAAVVAAPARFPRSARPPDWGTRALEFERVLRRASADDRSGRDR
jgi:glycosyltransferase involved in cell wall biosynthesis